MEALASIRPPTRPHHPPTVRLTAKARGTRLPHGWPPHTVGLRPCLSFSTHHLRPSSSAPPRLRPRSPPPPGALRRTPPPRTRAPPAVRGPAAPAAAARPPRTPRTRSSASGPATSRSSSPRSSGSSGRRGEAPPLACVSPGFPDPAVDVCLRACVSPAQCVARWGADGPGWASCFREVARKIEMFSPSLPSPTARL